MSIIDSSQKITLAVFYKLESGDTLLISLSSQDLLFPLVTSCISSKNKSLGLYIKQLQHLDNKLKNDLISIINETLDYDFISKIVESEGEKYQIFSIKAAFLENFIDLNKNLPTVYDKEKLVISFFLPISTQEKLLVDSLLKSFLKEKNFSFFDILQFVGIKNIIIFFLIFLSIDFAVSPDIINNGLYFFFGEKIQIPVRNNSN